MIGIVGQRVGTRVLGSRALGGMLVRGGRYYRERRVLNPKDRRK